MPDQTDEKRLAEMQATIRYSFGTEWRNHRGQVYVNLGIEHPHTRKDGFYARSKFVIEEQLAQGKVKLWDGQEPLMGNGPWLVIVPNVDHDPDDAAAREELAEAFLEPRYLDPDERVYHLEDPISNDDPSNLALFTCQAALARFRSGQYHSTTDDDYRDRLKGLTEAQKELRAKHGTKKAQQIEKRAAAARKNAPARRAALRAARAKRKGQNVQFLDKQESEDKE